MLLEQLKAQEQLRNEFEKNMKIVKDDTEKSIISEYEKQIGQIRAQLGAEKQEALLSLRYPTATINHHYYCYYYYYYY